MADVKNSIIVFKVNFDADVKNTTACHQCENRFRILVRTLQLGEVHDGTHKYPKCEADICGQRVIRSKTQGCKAQLVPCNT